MTQAGDQEQGVFAQSAIESGSVQELGAERGIEARTLHGQLPKGTDAGVRVGRDHGGRRGRGLPGRRMVEHRDTGAAPGQLMGDRGPDNAAAGDDYIRRHALILEAAA